MSSKIILAVALSAALVSCKKEQTIAPQQSTKTANTAKTTDKEKPLLNNKIKFTYGKEGTRISVLRLRNEEVRAGGDEMKPAVIYLSIYEEGEKGEKETVLLDKEPLYRDEENDAYRSKKGRDIGFADVDLVRNVHAILSTGTEVLLDGELYIFPEGKAVFQAPEPMITKVRFSEDKKDGEIMVARLVIGNDPAQDVTSVKFVPDPIAIDPKNPDKLKTFEPMILTKVTEWAEKGLSAWKVKYSGEISESWKKAGVAGKVYFGGTKTNTNFAILLQ